MHPTSLIPFLDPHNLEHFGVFAVLIVCLVIFAETGLLIGFVLPGDTLLVITGLLAHSGRLGVSIWVAAPAIALAAFLGGEVGYLIGRKAGPAIFERKDSGLFSRAQVDRTNAFFERFGGFAVIAARFVPIVRTFAPIAAGVGHMRYRRYTLYNAIGAVLWGFGLTFFGYLLGYIPPLARFVEQYIDVILIAVVIVFTVPTVWHVWSNSRKAKRAREATTD